VSAVRVDTRRLRTVHAESGFGEDRAERAAKTATLRLIRTSLNA
jgi:hypothetical protein